MQRVPEPGVPELPVQQPGRSAAGRYQLPYALHTAPVHVQWRGDGHQQPAGPGAEGRRSVAGEGTVPEQREHGRRGAPAANARHQQRRQVEAEVQGGHAAVGVVRWQ